VCGPEAKMVAPRAPTVRHPDERATGRRPLRGDSHRDRRDLRPNCRTVSQYRRWLGGYGRLNTHSNRNSGGPYQGPITPFRELLMDKLRKRGLLSAVMVFGVLLFPSFAFAGSCYNSCVVEATLWMNATGASLEDAEARANQCVLDFCSVG
jgi:hypothetical protein